MHSVERTSTARGRHQVLSPTYNQLIDYHTHVAIIIINYPLFQRRLDVAQGKLTSLYRIDELEKTKKCCL